jgi:hypothetical protein
VKDFEADVKTLQSIRLLWLLLVIHRLLQI